MGPAYFVLMYILYLDEFGHPGPYVPTDKRFQHHPLFGFAGFVIPGDKWRDFDRSYFRLKRRLYKREIARAQVLHGTRAERFEPKRLKDRRDIRFISLVMALIGKSNGCIFARGCVKKSTPKSHSYDGLYNGLMQVTLRAFEKYLRDKAGKARGRGIVIMDRRHESQNVRVLASAQSYLFSDLMFRQPDVRVTEIPLLVPSEWHHGVQAADGIGRAIGSIYWHRRMKNGHFKKYDVSLGPIVRAHTHTIGGWHSVSVQA